MVPYFYVSFVLHLNNCNNLDFAWVWTPEGNSILKTDMKYSKVSYHFVIEQT